MKTTQVAHIMGKLVTNQGVIQPLLTTRQAQQVSRSPVDFLAIACQAWVQHQAKLERKNPFEYLMEEWKHFFADYQSFFGNVNYDYL